MRAQIANSVFPVPISIPLPPQLTFDQVYDLVVGRLLHAKTCVYIADVEKGYKCFLQGLYIAQLSGMLNIPTNLDGLSKTELDRVEIQLSITNGLLKADMAFALFNGTDYAMDDSGYLQNLKLQDMKYRKSAE
ncbi:hypothetical protein HDU91_002281, partial [Kappamyces sp. JEL0680]